MHRENRAIPLLIAAMLVAVVWLASCANGDAASGPTDASDTATGSASGSADGSSSATPATTTETSVSGGSASPPIGTAPPTDHGSATSAPPATSQVPETNNVPTPAATTDSTEAMPPPSLPSDEPPVSAAPRQLTSITFVNPDQPTRSASVFGVEYATIVDPDEVLATVNAALDEPDHDSGWQAMPASLSCKGDTQYRSILWDDLRIVLERRNDNGSVRVGAWSLGEVALSFSPPLATDIGTASGVTSPSGLGIGSPATAIPSEGFPMVGVDGDRVTALTGVSPVIFEIDDDVVSAFSIEDNDCFAGTSEG